MEVNLDDEEMLVGSCTENVNNVNDDIDTKLISTDGTPSNRGVSNSQLEEEIDDITNKLIEKYNINIDDNLINGNSDEVLQAQRLISAKIIKSMYEKSKLKRLLSLTTLTEATAATLMANIKGLKQLDPDIMASIDMLFNWNTKLDRMTEEYSNITGVETSLENISQDKEAKRKEEEEIYNISQADRQKLIDVILHSEKK